MSESALRKSPSPGPDPERQQQEASNPTRSVWVSASAGSGKTTVLTKRVTRLLLDGVPPERILCLTFTRAAAAEMSMRVMAQLSLWATCSDEELDSDIDKLQNELPSSKQKTEARKLFASVLSCPGGMRIRTIHAFAQEILRRFPIEAGLPPHFAVIEENDAKQMQEDVLMELLRESTDTKGGLSQALNLLVCDLSEKGFRDAMRGALHDRARLDTSTKNADGFKNLIMQMREALELVLDETSKNILRKTVDFAILPQDEIRLAARQLAEGSKSFVESSIIIAGWLDLPPEERAIEFDQYAGCFLTKDGVPLKKLTNKDLAAKYPELDDILRREAERLQNMLEKLETALIAELTEAVLTVGSELNRRYGERKLLQAALDYDDLIINTDRLLRRPGIAPWVLYKLDGGLDHILVDEAQDTSRAQWSIIQTLTDEFFAGKSARDGINRTLFVVGDEKQSIFSFQNADPEAFADMRRVFDERIAAADKKLLPVSLHVSFRSAPAILKAVDTVFANMLARAGVSMEPVEHFPAPLRREDVPKIGCVEVWPLLPMPEKEKASDGIWILPLDYEAERDPQAELAARIADKISGWLKQKEKLSGTDQVISPGDIMILLRKRGRFADLMVRALKQRNVPVTGVDRMHLIKQLPVMDLLALMQFALLPEDDLNLASVLRGPILNLTEDQLMKLAIGRKGSLWHSLVDQASVKDFAAAHNYLAHLLSIADFTTPFAMLAHILNETCPGSTISGRRAIWSRLGPDALDPIEELLNAAQNFSRRHAPSLQAFIHWLTIGDSEIKRELDRGGGQVRIMTAHASKGLEAPIVFLPDTANVPRSQDIPKLQWNEEGIPFYLARKPGGGEPARLWQDARQKQLDEYRRLFYVALTRAASRLYICGWEVKKDADAETCWHNLAANALQALHEPAAAENLTPEPLVAFADPELQMAKVKNMPAKVSSQKIPMPDWARQPAPAEKTAPRTVAPSHAIAPATATPDSAFTRGRIIHRLLQSLPDAAVSERSTLAQRFLANPRHRLTTAQQNEIRNEVMKLLQSPEYAPLFGPNSRAEVPLVGTVKTLIISGQVDRLCLLDDAVWIVDFKTNRPPPTQAQDVPEAYRLQLASYRTLLQEIYPGKAIRCFLLWTYGPLLMELPVEMLAS